jgi:hypothetical protein
MAAQSLHTFAGFRLVKYVRKGWWWWCGGAVVVASRKRELQHRQTGAKYFHRMESGAPRSLVEAVVTFFLMTRGYPPLTPLLRTSIDSPSTTPAQTPTSSSTSSSTPILNSPTLSQPQRQPQPQPPFSLQPQRHPHVQVPMGRPMAVVWMVGV